MQRGMWILLLASLLPPLLFGQEKEKKKLDPCSLLTAADAASILGAPMPLVDRSKDSCTYGELGRKIAGAGRALDRDVIFILKTYKSAEARDKEWAKSSHNPANKEDVQVLSETGDEAFFFGSTKDGKIVGAFSVVAVRKGLVSFSLMISDKSGASSADAAFVVAKKIADQL